MCYLCVTYGLQERDAAHINAEIGSSALITRGFRTGSGTDYVDALVSGYSWTGGTGRGETVEYTFDATLTGGVRMPLAMQAAIKQAMNIWSSVTNITFTPGAANSELQFTMKDLSDLGSGVLGVTYVLNNNTLISKAEVQLDDQYRNLSILPGSEPFLVILHEIGHALGLKHPGNYNGSELGPFLESAADSTDNTVMSYNDGAYTSLSNSPTGLMAYDIAAIQYLYGANTNTSTGDNRYVLTGAKLAYTLWDGGGTDTLVINSGTQGAVIDLGEGIDKVTRVGDTRIWMAVGSRIENAEGSPIADTMYGNDVANRLVGYRGADALEGNAGNDSLYGGALVDDALDGNDTILGGDGGDTIYANGGNDIVYGATGSTDTVDGNDLIYGGYGRDLMYGNTGNDTIYGGSGVQSTGDAADSMVGGLGSDVIYGNGGDDEIYGGEGSISTDDSADTIYGGLGNDSIFSNAGADLIVGGPGDDFMHGGLGFDIYSFGNNSGNDSILNFYGDILRIATNINSTGIDSSFDMLSRITYSGTRIIVDLGAGNSIVIYGQSGTLTATDFEIV